MLFGVGGTADSGEKRNANEIHQRLPVSVGAVAGHGAKLQGTKGRGTQQLHRIKRGEHGLGILRGETAVFKTQRHAEGLVGGGNFDFLRGRKVFWGLCFQEEVQMAILRKFLLAAQANRRGRGTLLHLDALAEQGDGGALSFDFGLQVENAGVFESGVDGQRISGVEFRLRVGIGGREFQFILLIGAGQHSWGKADAIDVEAFHLIEARAFEKAVGISGVNAEAVEASGFGVGVKRNLVNLTQAELLDLESEPSGASLLQGDFNFDFVGLGTLPFRGDSLSLLILQGDFADAAGVVGLEVQGVFATYDQGAGVFGSDGPLGGSRGAEVVMRALEGAEAPGSPQGSRDLATEVGGLKGMRFDDEAAADGIRSGGEIDARSALDIDVERKVVGQFGGEYKGSAVGRDHDGGFASAEDLRAVDRAQGRRGRYTYRRQPDHYHRFGIAE